MTNESLPNHCENGERNGRRSFAVLERWGFRLCAAALIAALVYIYERDRADFSDDIRALKRAVNSLSLDFARAGIERAKGRR